MTKNEMKQKIKLKKERKRRLVREEVIQKKKKESFFFNLMNNLSVHGESSIKYQGK